MNRSDTKQRGATTGEHLVLVFAVALAAASSVAALGARMERAIARGDSSATAAASAEGPSSPVAAQAGIARIAALGLDLPPKNILRLGESAFSLPEVGRLRDGAHSLWKRVTAGEASPGATARVRLGHRDIEVGAVPRHSLAQATDLAASYGDTQSVWRVASYLEAQDRRFFAVLDDALDLAFAHGHTGTAAPRRLAWLGMDTQFDFHRDAYLPNGAWELRMHGEPTHFKVLEAPGRVRDVSATEVARELRGQGHAKGEPVILRVCHAGECAVSADGSLERNAAEQLADALESPVVAASDRVSPQLSGRVVVGSGFDQEGGGASSLGEWRLVQPQSWGELPASRRVVVGREAAPGELGLGSVLDLAHLPKGTARRIEVAGSPHAYGEANRGTFAAAHRALAPGGRLVLRAPKGLAVSPGNIRFALEAQGFVLRTVRAENGLFVLATKR